MNENAKFIIHGGGTSSLFLERTIQNKLTGNLQVHIMDVRYT
jgi:hypothetical protein